MAKHNYIFQIELDMEDFAILTKYGYDFEKNFSEAAKDVAVQLRIYEKEHDNDNQDEAN